MAENQFLYSPEWKILGTTSNPTIGFRKFYPKENFNNWYSVDSDGNEKQIPFTYLIKNGITETTLGTSSVLGTELNIALGRGLTFAGDYVGSTISVIGVTTDMLSVVNTGTAGFILSASGSNFEWIPNAPLGILGSTSRVPLFTSETSIGNSMINDDGSKVWIGQENSLATFSVDGSVRINGPLIWGSLAAQSINYSDGIIYSGRTHKFNDLLGFSYFTLTNDNTGLGGSFTASFLNNTIEIGWNGNTYNRYLLSQNSINFSLGTTSATSSFNFFSATASFRISDGSHGDGKVLVSDSTGLSTWVSLTSDYIIFNGLTNSLVKYDGLGGLTSSSIVETHGITASNRYLGIGNTFINNYLPKVPLHLHVNDSGGFTKFAIHNTDTTNGNSDKISFRSDTTGITTSFVEFTSIRSIYENHDDSIRAGRLEFWTSNIGGPTLSMSLLSDGTLYIKGTQSGQSALQFGSLTSSSPTTSSSVALSVDETGKVILANITSGGYINSPYDKGLTANSVTINGGTASDSTISVTPIQGSYVSVFVNGQEFQVGNGTTMSPCYFGTSSNLPKGFSSSNAIQSGDYIYWNPEIAGFNLESGWRISLHYLIQP